MWGNNNPYFTRPLIQKEQQQQQQQQVVTTSLSISEAKEKLKARRNKSRKKAAVVSSSSSSDDTWNKQQQQQPDQSQQQLMQSPPISSSSSSSSSSNNSQSPLTFFFLYLLPEINNFSVPWDWAEAAVLVWPCFSSSFLKNKNKKRSRRIGRRWSKETHHPNAAVGRFVLSTVRETRLRPPQRKSYSTPRTQQTNRQKTIDRSMIKLIIIEWTLAMMNQNVRYLPECTWLHRCSDDTGCCPDESQTCSPANIQSVSLPFFVSPSSTLLCK